MNRTYHIAGGRIIDPAADRDEIADLFIQNGVILEEPPPGETPVRIDASGLTVAPGFTDIHVHLREPGNEQAETIESGSRAAACGGFTRIVAMPNTTPPADTPEQIEATIGRGDAAGRVMVLPSACITRGRKGKALADLAALASAGAVAFTDDGNTVPDPDLMEAAARIARRLNIAILDHALDPALAGPGVLHAGNAASCLNLPGIPSEAEVVIVQRDIDICRQTGCRMHIQHLSAAESVELVRRARREGLPVTAEVTPHHLALSEDNVTSNDANFKMNPPLRTVADRAALLAGVADGTIQALATDHAPHTRFDKAKGLRTAPPGVVGLETAIGVTYTTLVRSGRMSPIDWIRRWTSGPSAVLGLESATLQPGSEANVTILDLESEWRVEPDSFESRSRNTPFVGWTLFGRAVRTFYRGRPSWPVE